MRAKIKDWYLRQYPTDELGEKINPAATFEGLMKNPSKVYSYLNVQDSVVRERVFMELADRAAVTYDLIYKRWLISETTYRKAKLFDGREVWVDPRKQHYLLGPNKGKFIGYNCHFDGHLPMFYIGTYLPDQFQFIGNITRTITYHKI
jgi:hypothetical protein